MQPAVLFALLGGSTAVVAGGVAIYAYTGGFDSPPEKPAVTQQQPAKPKTESVTEATPKVTAPDKPAATVKAPQFDIIRVEPSGDAVIAGSAEPGATVAVTANGKVIGKTTANKQGEWVLTLKQPLPPGNHDVSAQTEINGKTVPSQEHVAVVIQDNKADAPLVVMSTPGKPSTIVQAPKAADPKPDEPKVAVAEPKPAEPKVAVTEPKPVEPKPDEPKVAVTPIKPADPKPAEPKVAEPKVAVADPKPADPKPADPAPATPEVKVTPSEPKPEEPKTPIAEQPKTEPKVDAPKPMVVVDAAQFKDDQVVVSGKSVPGARVEVRVGKIKVGEAVADKSGNWTLKAPAKIDAGSHEIQVAQVAPDTGKPVAQAAKTAIREPDPKVSIAAAKIEDGKVEVSGQTVPGKKVQVRVGDVVVGETQADEDGKWTLSVTKDIKPGNHDVTAAQLADDGKPAAQTLTMATREADPEIAIAAVSIKDGQIKVTGKTNPGKSVQVMLDGKPIGEATADATGAWTLSIKKPLDPGEYNVDAALVTNDGTTIVADKSTLTRQHDPKVTVEAVEVEEKKLFVAGATVPNGRVRVYMNDEFIGEATAGPTGRWLLEIERSVDAGQYRVRADQVNSDKGMVLARSEVPFEREPDQIAMRPIAISGEGSGAVGSGATSSGTVQAPQAVIIRRGDNLWRISRRLYGHGIRFSTIYQANTEQIRDPHWIYPGQVFTIPKGDTAWNSKIN